MYHFLLWFLQESSPLCMGIFRFFTLSLTRIFFIWWNMLLYLLQSVFLGEGWMLPNKHMTLAEGWHYLKALFYCGWKECHGGFLLCSLRDLLYLFTLSYDWPPSSHLCHSLEDFRETSDIPEEVSSHAQEAPPGGAEHPATLAMTLLSTLISKSFDFSLCGG